VIALVLVLLGCGADVAAPMDDGPVAVRVALDGPVEKGGGALIVTAWYSDDGALDLPPPAAEGLTFSPDGAPRTERLGDRSAVTQRYVFRGRAGSYEIPPIVATWTGADGATSEVASDSVFIDLDAAPPVTRELADIVDPPVLVRVPWVPILSVAALAGIGAAFLARRRRRARAPEPARPVPPDVACLRAWDAVRHDPRLTIDDKARELSVLFRAYVEDVLGFEATARTTSEILAHLRSLAHLPEGNVTRAQRILRATDRVKFAEERPAEEWLAELDADLRAFVQSTRPTVFVEQPAEVAT
jgi:hypothetical protein